ncbi:uridine kinase, partial [Aquipuribacter hungaricus]
RVGVDGVDGAGKTVFADDLAEVLRSRGRTVVRVGADAFLHPRAVRYRRGRDSPEGFWLDSYDYVALRRRVLDPLGPDGSRRYQTASLELRTDQASDPPVLTAAPGSVLVLDGLFLHRDELVDVWDVSVFLQVPFEVSAARMASRDGSHPDPAHPSLARYVQGQRLYLTTAQPEQRAHVVVDATDLDAPVIASHR